MTSAAEKFSITLNPDIASYLKKMAKALNAPISKVIAFALVSQKKKDANLRRKDKLIKAYKQIADNYNHAEFKDFESAQWELSKEID